MMNSVRKSARPTSTVLGGVCAVPSACRSKDSTMMMRTNEVIISSSDGSSVSVVINASNCKVRLYCCPPLPLETLTMGKP